MGVACAGTLLFVLLSVPLLGRSSQPDDLPQLLRLARTQVEDFVEQFAYLRYHEDIIQQKLKDSGKVAYQQETGFDSLIMVRFNEGQLHMREQRLLERAPSPHLELRPLVLTYGFSALAMIFHPYYEPSFRFTRMEDASLQGKTLARVHFENIPGTPSPALYQMPSGDRQIELSGIAWIDPATGAIHRIDANVGSTLADLGLKSLRAQLTYGPVKLKIELQPMWLPVSATIDLETPHQHWRNIHQFENYREYRSEIKLEASTPNDN